jgi:DUF4097 and DUF4098 domain-containing protein YvlB
MRFRAIQNGFALILLSIVATGGVLGRPLSRNDDVYSQRVERTVSADPSVMVSTCVMSGSISVNGWDRDEVSARSSNATQIELRQKDGKAQAGKATRLEVFVIDKSGEAREKENCQAYSDLELFVPRAASVHVQTRDGDIDIADIAVVVAGTQNGEINIERISRAVEVGSVGGSVFIKDSTGRASVTTIGGGIEVANLRPSSAVDGFEAVSVSGDLNLEGVSHSQFNARTVTGNVRLTGSLAAGGRYGFKTLSGDITLTLPSDSSFSLNAKVSKDGEIISDFPLTLIPDAPTPPQSPVVTPPATAVSTAPPKSPAPGPAATAPVSPFVVKVKPRISNVIVTTPSVTISVPTMRRVNAVCGAGAASIQVASFSGTLQLLKN